MEKIEVAYHHDPADLQIIYLAVVAPSAVPRESDWKPALRDTRTDGQRVLWIRANVRPGQQFSVWLKDRNGARRVPRLPARP